MKLIDLSIDFDNDTKCDIPGNSPKIIYHDHKDEYSVKSFSMVFRGVTQEELIDGETWATEKTAFDTHNGTHMYAPYHFHSTMNMGEPAWTIDQVPLEWCVGPGVAVDMGDKPTGYQLTSKDFIAYFEKIHYTLKSGDVVLLHSNARTKWDTDEYWRTGCGVGREGTLWLLDKGVHCVGTDAWSWDIPLPVQGMLYAKTKNPSIIWEGHKAGCEKAYVQIEKLCNLETLPKFGFKFYTSLLSLRSKAE